MASLFSNGHALIIGLSNTSVNPLPIAYMMTQIRIPTYGEDIMSGSIARDPSPTPLVISATTIQDRLPILSTNFAQIKSTTSCG